MAISLLVLKKTKLNKLLSLRDIILIVVLIFSFNIIFFTHIPVTADRSVSIYILGYVNKENKPLSSQVVSQQFTEKYLNEYGGIDRRLNEQIASGNIVRVGNNYQITKQGQILMKFYSLVADIFGINKRNLSQ